MPDSDSHQSEPGELLPQVIADAAAAAVGLPLGPAGSLVTAATTPFFELLAQWAWEKISEDRRRRINEMLARAWHATGLDANKFARRIGRNERTRLLTATAMTGAAATAWPPRVVAIGKLLGQGLLSHDEDELDVIALAMAAMAEMERPHVDLLSLLANYVPYFDTIATTVVPYLPSDLGPPRWAFEEISEVRPKLRPAFPGLIGTLVRHGLVEDNNDAGRGLTATIQGFQKYASGQSAQLGPHVPQIESVRRTWSPTELGQKVLSLYIEAGSGRFVA